MATDQTRWVSRTARLLALALLAAGCGSGDRPAAQSPAAEAEDEAPATPAAALPADEAPVDQAALPAAYPGDFPVDVPRFPGSQVTSARGSADEGFAVSIAAPGEVAEVAKFYGDGLTEHGWAVEVQESAEGSMIIAVKQGGRAQAFVHGGADGAVVDLIVGRVQ